MKNIILLLLSATLICCKATKEHTIESYAGKVIIFGNQGGFTNNSTEFRIYEDGQFEKYQTKPQALTQLNKLDSKNCNQLFNNFYTLGFDKIDLNKHSNMNKYIKLKEGEKEIKLLWGTDTKAPQKLNQYYKVLGQIAKQSKIIE